MTVTHGFKGDKPYISTCKGSRFYIDTPVFDIEEIAHAGGNLCRFGGHTRRFYSVAEHSVLVATIMDQLGLGDPFEGLMHDGHESYLMDMMKPWKAKIPGYSEVEKVLEVELRIAFSLPEDITDGCKTADWIALGIEARYLLADKGSEIEFPEGIQAQVNRFRDGVAPGSSRATLPCFAPELARDHFLACYAELRNGRGPSRV